MGISHQNRIGLDSGYPLKKGCLVTFIDTKKPFKMFMDHTGAKPNFLSKNSLEFDV